MASIALITTVADATPPGGGDGMSPADAAVNAAMPGAGAPNFTVPLRPKGADIPATHMAAYFGDATQEQIDALNHPLRFADGNGWGRLLRWGDFWDAISDQGLEVVPPAGPGG